MFDSFQIFADVSRPLVLNGTQGNEVYGGASSSAGIFLHRSSDDAVVKGGNLRTYSTTYLVVRSLLDNYRSLQYCSAFTITVTKRRHVRSEAVTVVYASVR